MTRQEKSANFIAFFIIASVIILWHIRHMTSKDEIKKWLKAHNRNYNWLAVELGMTHRAVRNMFSKNGVLSHRAVLLIETLMDKRQFSIPIEFAVTATIKLTTEEFAYFSKLAKDACMTTEEWVVSAIRYAGEHPEIIDEIIRQEQGKKNSD